MNNPNRRVMALSLFCLATLAAPPVLGHGEMDEQLMADFHLHLDDFRKDVEHLIAQAEVIAAAHAAGESTEAAMDALIEEWEAVSLHAAIETRATVIYPSVWQALIALQQATGAGESDEAVAAAARALQAALWQGFGAVRLAASQVEAAAAPPAAEAPPASGPATIGRILADLDKAVAAYRADELARAESLIHQTYMNRFEGLEGELIARDPELVSNLEKDFNATLPMLMQQGASEEKVEAALAAMKAQLETASRILEAAEQSRSEVF